MNKTFLVWLSVGLLVGVSSVALAKRADIARFVAIHATQNLNPGIEDFGTPEQIAEAKLRTVDIFKREFQLGNLKPDKQYQIGLGADTFAANQLKKNLENIYTATDADKEFNDILAMFKADKGQGLDLTFDSVNFEVDEWQGVQIRGDSITEVFVGHAVFSSASTNWNGTTDQWTFHLTLDPADGLWKEESKVGVRIGD